MEIYRTIYVHKSYTASNNNYNENTCNKQFYLLSKQQLFSYGSLHTVQLKVQNHNDNPRC